MGVMASSRPNRRWIITCVVVLLFIIVGVHLHGSLPLNSISVPFTSPAHEDHTTPSADVPATNEEETEKQAETSPAEHSTVVEVAPSPTNAASAAFTSPVLLSDHKPGFKTPKDFKFDIEPSDMEGLKGVQLPDLDDYEVRGMKMSTFLTLDPVYPLEPFPHSPLDSGEEPPHHPWLGAVVVSAFDLGRRALIRNTWMTLYKDTPIDKKFVICNPGPQWRDIISRENRTFGDLIILEHIQEDDFTANTVKSMELFRYLSETSPRKYSVISKVDTDMWLNAPAMWERKIKPLLAEDEWTLAANRTIIGQFFWDRRFNIAMPHGAMYTMTWDLVELLPKLDWKFNIVRNEDMIIGWVLSLAKQRVNFIHLSYDEKFDFFKGDAAPGTCWAFTEKSRGKQYHAVYGKDAIAVHMLKKDEDWVLVSQCFDEQGVKPQPKPPKGLKPLEDKDYLPPWFRAIPKEFWEKDKDGRTVVIGVYTLEEGVGPYFEKKKGH